MASADNTLVGRVCCAAASLGVRHACCIWMYRWRLDGLRCNATQGHVTHVVAGLPGVLTH